MLRFKQALVRHAVPDADDHDMVYADHVRRSRCLDFPLIYRLAKQRERQQELDDKVVHRNRGASPYPGQG